MPNDNVDLKNINNSFDLKINSVWLTASLYFQIIKINRGIKILNLYAGEILSCDAIDDSIEMKSNAPDDLI